MKELILLLLNDICLPISSHVSISFNTSQYYEGLHKSIEIDCKVDKKWASSKRLLVQSQQKYTRKRYAICSKLAIKTRH